MGDPKKQRKKYQTPSHPWERDRIEKEKILTENYGLKNKKEIWKAQSMLRKFTAQTKKLIATHTEQAKKEEQQLLSKLFKYNLITKDAKIEDVLAIDINKILERRLQTMVFKKNIARTPNQSRQFITHGHIFVDNKKVDVPSYLISRDEENKISINPSSTLSKDDHPERKIKPKKVKKESKEENE